MRTRSNRRSHASASMFRTSFRYTTTSSTFLLLYVMFCSVLRCDVTLRCVSSPLPSALLCFCINRQRIVSCSPVSPPADGDSDLLGLFDQSCSSPLLLLLSLFLRSSPLLLSSPLFSSLSSPHPNYVYDMLYCVSLAITISHLISRQKLQHTLQSVLYIS